MSRRRLENLDPERQAGLFDSAAREFSAHGFEGASLNRILDVAEMGKSSFYYYFDDKADLFATVMERALAELFAETGGFDPDALTGDDFWPAFTTLYKRLLAAADSNPQLVQLGGLFYQLRTNRRDGSATSRLVDTARDWAGRIIARGQALGVVRADLPLALLVDTAMALLGALDRWSVAHWTELSREDMARLPEQHIALFRRLLAPETDTGTH